MADRDPEVDVSDRCVSVVPESGVRFRLYRCISLLPHDMDTFSKLKQFDAYPKTLEDFRVKTWGGATGERLKCGSELQPFITQPVSRTG